MNRDIPPHQIFFDPTPEIFASDTSGSFHFPLLYDGQSRIEMARYDEARFVFSLWHPSAKSTIDLDRAYAELRACFDHDEEHWIKLAEIEPVVPPYSGGESFDGWIVLPVLASSASFSLYGSGLEARTRVQIRASVYLVA